MKHSWAASKTRDFAWKWTGWYFRGNPKALGGKKLNIQRFKKEKISSRKYQ